MFRLISLSYKLLLQLKEQGWFNADEKTLCWMNRESLFYCCCCTVHKDTCTHTHTHTYNKYTEGSALFSCKSSHMLIAFLSDMFMIYRNALNARSFMSPSLCSHLCFGIIGSLTLQTGNWERDSLWYVTMRLYCFLYFMQVVLILFPLQNTKNWGQMSKDAYSKHKSINI